MSTGKSGACSQSLCLTYTAEVKFTPTSQVSYPLTFIHALWTHTPTPLFFFPRMWFNSAFGFRGLKENDFTYPFCLICPIPCSIRIPAKLSWYASFVFSPVFAYFTKKRKKNHILHTALHLTLFTQRTQFYYLFWSIAYFSCSWAPYYGVFTA